MTVGKIHKVVENRFRIKGSPLLCIYPKASIKTQRLLYMADCCNWTVKVYIKKVIGCMAIVQYVRVDRYGSRAKMSTRLAIALAENSRNMLRKSNETKMIHGRGRDTTGV